MKNRNSDSNISDPPRLRDIFKNDILEKGHFRERHKEWKELQEFYLSDTQKQRLNNMKPIKALLWKIGWIFKSMFLKLSPFRRVLVAIAIFLPLVSFNNGSENISLYFPLSSVLLVLVILLELKDKLLARDELQAGRKIQHALMPERNPHVEGWQIVLYTRSANEVGGDLVDFLRIDSKRIGISVADISGKGLHAALLMSKLQATIRAIASNEIPTAKLISRVNDIFHRDTPSSIFASLLYIELAPACDEIKFINAGHLPPFLFQGGELHEMAKGDLGLGLKAGTEYSEKTISMIKGDVFVGYSDGITEARNEAGEFYGLERFKNLLSQQINLDADQLGKQVIQEIEKFVGEASMNDDMSLIILKRE